jgi:hypothetical protein
MMKTVKELVLSIANAPGALREIISLLNENGIYVVALFLTTRGKKEAVHIIADDPLKALNVLKTAGHKGRTREVVMCEIPSHPGGLNAVLKPLKEAGLPLDYVYSAFPQGDASALVLAVDNPEEAFRSLESAWIRVLDLSS